MWLPTRLGIWLWLVSLGTPASAQILVAHDDIFAIPYDVSLEVQAFGVLESDELDGETAGGSRAMAQSVSHVTHGTLTLAADGSFTHTIGPSFDGSDHFVYPAGADGATPVDATVTLTACGGARRSSPVGTKRPSWPRPPSSTTRASQKASRMTLSGAERDRRSPSLASRAKGSIGVPTTSIPPTPTLRGLSVWSVRSDHPAKRIPAPTPSE
jgi:hypothetical protein